MEKMRESNILVIGLSSACMVIENAFDWLKGTFGCLRRPMDVKMKELPHFIMSTFILRNFCKITNEMLLMHVYKM